MHVAVYHPECPAALISHGWFFYRSVCQSNGLSSRFSFFDPVCLEPHLSEAELAVALPLLVATGVLLCCFTIVHNPELKPNKTKITKKKEKV